MFNLIAEQDKVIQKLLVGHKGYRWRTARAFRKNLLRQGYTQEQSHAIVSDTMDMLHLQEFIAVEKQ